MASPRHLWSGDWARESANAADEIARGRAQARPAAPEREESPKAQSGRTAPPAPGPPSPAQDRTSGQPAVAPPRARTASTPGRPDKPAVAPPRVDRTGPRRRRRRARTAAVLVLVLALGSAAAFAIGAFGAGSPATSHLTGGFALPQPWLGLTTTHSHGAGALVTNVALGGPADQAGLQRGDVITAINGQAITRPAEFTSIVDSQPVGAEVLLQINHGGALETVGVIVSARPGGSP